MTPYSQDREPPANPGRYTQQPGTVLDADPFHARDGHRLVERSRELGGAHLALNFHLVSLDLYLEALESAHTKA